MSDSDECSQPKRQKVITSDNDVKHELFLTDSSDENIFSDEDDASQSSFSDSSIKNEPVLLENKDLSAGSSQQDIWGRSQPTTSSTPATEVESIPFNEKQNTFFENFGSAPMNYFNFFFDEELLLFICEQTNAQAAKLLQISKANSILRLWKDLTICELKVFLGLLFHMGTIPLQRLQDYWRTDRLFSIPIFTNQMSRNRFEVIMKCLYFTSETENPDDRLFKTRVLIDYFNHKMDTCYYPGKPLCLDDSMVFWKDLLQFSQYVKNTSINFVNRIKLYMLTEPDGLIVKFLAFPRRREDLFLLQDHTENVVMQLMENKLHKGHSMYMDISYNSVSLARKLLENKTYCTGMLRKDLQDNPVEITQENLKRGKNVSFIKDGVAVHKFQDKHPELYITTEFPCHLISVTKSRGQTSMKPLAISKYNEIMLGVDRQQHLLEYYPCAHKYLRWYMKIAIHIFHMLFLNSHKLYNKYSGDKMYFNDYRLIIINQLLPENTVDPSIPGPSGRHTISRITERNSKGNVKRKACRHCWKCRRPKNTSFHCLECPGIPGICMECFDAYHRSSGVAT